MLVASQAGCDRRADSSRARSCDSTSPPAGDKARPHRPWPGIRGPAPAAAVDSVCGTGLTLSDVGPVSPAAFARHLCGRGSPMALGLSYVCAWARDGIHEAHGKEPRSTEVSTRQELLETRHLPRGNCASLRNQAQYRWALTAVPIQPVMGRSGRPSANSNPGQPLETRPHSRRLPSSRLRCRSR